jgi:RNA polymerase sigma factor (TIGR02999 family)
MYPHKSLKVKALCLEVIASPGGTFNDLLYSVVVAGNSIQDVGPLMAAFRQGNSAAGARLIDIFYPELKRMAASKLRGERQGHSWQPTLLVNELYLQMVNIKALQPDDQDRPNDRAAFLALSGQIMKRLLIHHARPLSAKAQKVPLWEDMQCVDGGELAEVESLLSRLASMKPMLRTVVEMKVFEGRTAAEIASELKCSPITVHRYWQFAKRWLKEEWHPVVG